MGRRLTADTRAYKVPHKGEPRRGRAASQCGCKSLCKLPGIQRHLVAGFNCSPKLKAMLRSRTSCARDTIGAEVKGSRKRDGVGSAVGCANAQYHLSREC